MQQQLYKPHPALQEFVSGILIYRADLRHTQEDIVCPFPPTPQNYIYFYLNDPVQTQKNGETFYTEKAGSITVGPQLTRVNLNIGKDHFMLGIIFHPGGLHRLLGMPMHGIVDTDMETRALLGGEIQTVYTQLQNAETWGEMKMVAESFLLRQLQRLRPALPFDFAIQELVKQGGGLSMEKTASLACLSLRQFERQCLERIGLPPKLFARLIRFSKAYQLKEHAQQVSWTSVAHTCGYYDQMHFIRDFREFAGVTPTGIQSDWAATPLRLQGNITR
ncbi:MAG TPA: helix-turn-helix domain-containing protein [Sediminibacterium sp.]|nr:helix-turn-helix domain-containing protein [Sediminibacterium sp.]